MSGNAGSPRPPDHHRLPAWSRSSGYAQTSTLGRKAGLEAQGRELQEAGCTKLSIEQVSSVDAAKRDKLDLTLEYLREGDTLVVTKLDRLCRSVAHLLEILERVRGKGAHPRILNLGVDPGSATGELVLTILEGIAAFERSIMLERRREGIAKAKAEGKYKGRKPTARATSEEMKALHAQGIGATDIARRLGIGRASVSWVLGRAEGWSSQRGHPLRAQGGLRNRPRKAFAMSGTDPAGQLQCATATKSL